MVNLQNVADEFRGEEGVLFVARGRHEVSVSWTGARDLLVTCASCPRQSVFRQVVRLGDVAVSYSLSPAGF